MQTCPDRQYTESHHNQVAFCRVIVTVEAVVKEVEDEDDDTG